jgi:3-oxoacyl-[acyl-carrier protein] reductase
MSKRVAFVTGASRGIGRAIAFSLCRAGFDVVFAARGIEQNEELAAEIGGCESCGGQSMRVNLDVTSPDSIKDAFSRTLKEKTRIDVLVNNAGITRDGLAVRMKAADWDGVLDLNLGGSFRCIQQVLPGMMRNRWGRIINITSIVGQAGSAGQANYAASKAGLIGLTKSLAQEMGSRGVTVNAVSPGYIDTDMTKGLPEELKTKILAQVPLGRMGQPEDIAHAVKFLAGEEAGYITGQVLAVNGGMYM